MDNYFLDLFNCFKFLQNCYIYIYCNFYQFDMKLSILVQNSEVDCVEVYLNVSISETEPYK